MTKFGIGQAVRRVEDRRFTTGVGAFVGDLVLPRQCYGVPVFSPHAHAKIERVDVSAAKVASGVICVLTGADAAAIRSAAYRRFSCRNPGADRRVSPHYGRCCLPIACGVSAIMSLSLSRKRKHRRATPPNSSQSIIEPLPALIDLEEAAKPQAMKIWPDCPNGNIGVTIAFGDEAATDAAFVKARHVAKVRLVNNRVTANPIEPRCAVGV